LQRASAQSSYALPRSSTQTNGLSRQENPPADPPLPLSGSNHVVAK
jgi:hypothetical protein